MPETLLGDLDRESLQSITEYKSGYDWVPGRFGPPPGIPESKKNEFDKMTDKDFLYAFMRLAQEEKESLMVSEAERRRTFTAHWPIEHIVKGNDLAKEGFFYTGVADKVQCVFCCGYIRNWERGDTPTQAHLRYFSYCKMALRKPCSNIPYDNKDVLKSLACDKLQLRKNNNSLKMDELAISSNKPCEQKYSIVSERRFRTYDVRIPIPADSLCDAGFYFCGSADKVTCFWSDGSLEYWNKEEDPWTEHARWYPGCSYVRQVKGTDFIRKARANMSKEDLATADSLEYNKADLSFLEVAEKPLIDIKSLFTYRTCVKLGLDEHLVCKAFELNKGKDYDSIQSLISVVYILEDDMNDSAGKIKDLINPPAKDSKTQAVSTSLGKNSSVSIKVEDIVTKTEDLTLVEIFKLLKVNHKKRLIAKTSGNNSQWLLYNRSV